MLIDDAIKALHGLKEKGETHAVVAWWEAADFDVDSTDENVDWGFISEQIEDQMDWSSTNDKMLAIADSFD